MPKRKTLFTDELRQKYPCFRKERSDFEAECIRLLVDMARLFLWQTKVVLASMTILKPRSISRLLEVKMKPHLHLK